MIKIERKFIQQINNKSDINEHIQTLYDFAKECNHVTEMGVRWVSSTWALVYTNPKKIISYDIIRDQNIDEVISLCEEYNINYSFEEKDVLNIEIEDTDLLFIDTLHTYNQLISELEIHSEKVKKYIILHDTETFGEKDELIYNHASEKIKLKSSTKKGLMNAIKDFLVTPLGEKWEIYKHYTNNNGLTVLKNKKYEKS
jgi:hypothetical protein